MKDIQHVIWDWNGTLLNDLSLSIASINKVLSKRAMPQMNEEQYRSVFGFPVKDYYRRIGFDFQEESFEVVGTEFIQEYDSKHLNCKLQAGARGVLTSLKMQGVSQSILSARKKQQLDEELEHHRIEAFFDVVSGLDHHYASSKLDNGFKLLANLRLEPASVLLVGDTLHDAEVAAELGVNCILFCGGHQSESKLRAANVPLIEKLSELRPIEK